MKPQGVALYPFVPSGSNFAVSIDFFAELGFEKLWQHDGLAGLRFGAAYFLLQDIDIADEVDDLDAYWSELNQKDLPGRFSGVRLRPPTDFPWGREIHIIDPGGVCWHVRQATRQAFTEGDGPK